MNSFFPGILRAWPLIAWSTCALALQAQSQVRVDAIVTPLSGSYHYDLTIRNDGADDLVLLSLVDAPLGDPLIPVSLTTPPGFLASYDGGLGFVDFLADTEVFGAGSSLGGFTFESLGAPGGFFSMFQGLDVLGNSFSGSIRITPGNVVVPEASTVLGAFVLVGGVLVQVARRRFSQR